MENEQRALLVTFLFWTAQSVLCEHNMAAYVFLLAQSNYAVGLFVGVQASMRLLIALPQQFFTVCWRRDQTLKLAAALGLVSGFLILQALNGKALDLLCIATGLWTMCQALLDTTLDAMLSESLSLDQLKTAFHLKQRSRQAALVLGPGMCAVYFLSYGNAWQLRSLELILAFGVLLAMTASAVLFSFQSSGYHSSSSGRQGSLMPSFLCTRSSALAKAMGTDMAFDLDGLPSAYDQAGETLPLLQAAETSYEDESAVTCGCVRPDHIPALIIVSDLIQTVASGLSTCFFAMYFLQSYAITPFGLNLLFLVEPFVIALLCRLACRVARWNGMVSTLLSFRVVAFWSVLGMAEYYPVWFQVVCFLSRGGLLAGAQVLRRHILMQNTDRHHRMWWNALDHVSVLVWSTSVVSGGYLVHLLGYRIMFACSAFFYLVVMMIEMVLLPLVKVRPSHSP